MTDALIDPKLEAALQAAAGRTYKHGTAISFYEGQAMTILDRTAPGDKMSVGMRPLATAPRNQVIIGFGDGLLSPCIIEEAEAVTESRKRWPWSAPETIVTRNAGTYFYIAVPSGDGYTRLVSRGGWRPTHWMDPRDLDIELVEAPKP